VVLLRGYLEKRDEREDASRRFVAVLAQALPPVDDGRRVAVTRGVFDAFLRYQAAWARKTRDRKNPGVTPRQVEAESARASALKEEFRLLAAAQSPEFYRVFQAAVRDVRRAPMRGGRVWAGDSAVFFADQVDASYTHVDAGDVALEAGDARKAIEEADKALRENPANADAYVLRAGARYERGDAAGAAEDARHALILDPRNEQAQALMSLTGGPAAPDAPAAAADAPPSATPAVGALLSYDMTARGAEVARSDARGSVEYLSRAVRLDPRNEAARSWQGTVLNRLGQFGAALGSAESWLTGSPENPEAWFQKGHALAGAGRRTDAVAAAERAASLSAAYAPLAERARQAPQPEDLALVFGDWALSHQPPLPAPRRRGQPLPLLLLGGAGLSLVFAAGAVLLRKGR
jgi:tetratricopeptide (TPR) repeat protein